MKNLFNNLPERGTDAFFDELDARIKSNPTILEELVNKADYPIIASGGFVKALQEIHVEPTVSTIGGLRKSRELDLSKYSDVIKGNKFTFLDDSYYKGRTLRKINKEIVRLGGSIEQIIVVYDDTCEFPLVESLYNRK